MKNKKMWQIPLIVFVVFAAVLGILYFTLTGPEHLSQYPPASASPYRLPWAAGQTYRCVQSNRGIVSHRDWERFAYDFGMPVGTEICAARAGTVTQVVIDHDGHGYHWPNNLVAVKHDDGTIAYYLHLKKGGSKVNVGDHVEQGQVIALSGHVGNSMMPHLHFHVRDAEKKVTIPITFADVATDSGIPRMFKRYTSGNTGKAISEPPAAQ